MLSCQAVAILQQAFSYSSCKAVIIIIIIIIKRWSSGSSSYRYRCWNPLVVIRSNLHSNPFLIKHESSRATRSACPQLRPSEARASYACTHTTRSRHNACVHLTPPFFATLVRVSSQPNVISFSQWFQIDLLSPRSRSFHSLHVAESLVLFWRTEGFSTEFSTVATDRTVATMPSPWYFRQNDNDAVSVQKWQSTSLRNKQLLRRWKAIIW